MIFSSFCRWIVGSVIVLLASVGAITGWPQAVQASVVLDQASEVVNIITVYPTTTDTQSQTLSAVSQGESNTFSSVPGFRDAAILTSQEGNQVIALSQWNSKDITSFESYAQEHVLSIPAGQSAQSFACQVQHTETRSASPRFQQGDVVMFSQFKMKPDRAQPELAMVISQMMPGVLEMIPGLQWAAMCPSLHYS
jgi:hypothetical protein